LDCAATELRRSPRADATLCGMISGLRLSATEDDLALLYLATIQVPTVQPWQITGR
jgi:ribulose kinase